MYSRRWYIRHREMHNKRCADDYHNRRQNPDWVAKFRARARDYMRRQFEANPSIRIAIHCRSLIRRSLLAKKPRPSSKAARLLGCTIPEYRAYLESKFKPGMTWENWGKSRERWHIDHIVPLSSFDLTDPEQLARCYHYTNTQPLWWIDNIRKNPRPTLDIPAAL